MSDIDLNNLSDNPEEILKAFEKLEAGDLPNDEPQEEDKEKQNDDAPTSEDEQETSNEDEQDDAEGVATKDGKHIIPYSVLKSERDARAKAEQLARDAQERVAALESQLQGKNQEAKPGEDASTQKDPQDPTTSIADLSDEELAALKEDFPSLYKTVVAFQKQAQMLEAKLQPIENQARFAEEARQRSEAEQVQDAIDANPKLAFIQTNNKDAFDLAVQFDATLRQQAAWANKPLCERFAKVVAMVETTNGAIDLPKGNASQKAGDLAKAAKEKAAQLAKANGTHIPTTLSEFPAGAHVAQDEREAIEKLTHQQLADKFASMSPDQVDAYLQSL